MNNEQAGDNLPADWGELLAGADVDTNRRGEVVTAVRFDGVDQPTFRQPADQGSGLAGEEA